MTEKPKASNLRSKVLSIHPLLFPLSTPAVEKMFLCIRCGFLLCVIMPLQCADYEGLISLWVTRLAEERRGGVGGGVGGHVSPFTLQERKPDRCCGHEQPSTARRHHAEHAHLTFLQRTEISGLNQRMWAWTNEWLSFWSTVLPGSFFFFDHQVSSNPHWSSGIFICGDI